MLKEYKFFALCLPVLKKSNIKSNLAMMNKGKKSVGKTTSKDKDTKALRQALQQADGGGSVGSKLAAGLNQNANIIKKEKNDVCP